MINFIRKIQPIIKVYAFSTTKMNRIKTLYQVLQVPTNATATIIKKNYLKLAKIYHPDVYKGADKNRFQKIQEAYKTLSNQTDRNKYDETIGVGSVKQQFSQKPSNEGQSSYGKPKNDFKYQKPKQQINIDEQYEKFFNKKSSTHFEDIRLHQPTQFKKMSQTQRIRRRFTQIYTDQNLNWKMKYSKSYTEILGDQINQKNKYDEQLKQQQKDNEIRNSQKYISMRTKWLKRLIWLLFILILPFAYSFRIKYQLARQSKAMYQKKIDDIFADMETEQIRKRMHF